MLPWTDRLISTTLTLERAASMMFVLGISRNRSQISRPPSSHGIPQSQTNYLPILSAQATLDRNSQFYELTDEDREKLGGIEYRSLKLLLKVVIGYFIGLHLFGAICLVPWMQHTSPNYQEYLAECGQDKVWWGIYSAQTMVNNLGFTLTPDSMIHFQDATYPLLLMSFLAYAGNTCYPCLLRLVIWIMSKLCPEYSSRKESLSFLLSHPRRCYTLLFPGQTTWLLFGILVAMNLIDIVLILVLDLHNSAANHLPLSQRIIATIFQAASSRHTGTSIFNLADVHPAVQISLLVMMYISIFPIALGVRASNVFEEKALGVYSLANEIDERDGRSYFLAHIRNQLTFDLWYIFLGIFCICIAEAERIMDNSDPAFSVFSVFFEVVSAYGNVGLSLGYPTVSTSLSGQFTTFSKLVICAMMVRGRHRGLPYKLDRAIVLPIEHLARNDTECDSDWRGRQAQQLVGIRRIHTS
ncbi:cation transporter [Penicillium riverlandense]|uniref:cation transporter n=1 Tax=Penicillium riverlandense TaxID=1903569 RepID=UPI002548F37F|nr:cation transporter [Penicillium riverlandense]KAJ5820090.1 cation transporter [Penicillium riverlandense]